MNQIIPEELKAEGIRFTLVNPENKRPIEPEWQIKNNYTHNDDKLKNHYNKHKCYGVLCGVKTQYGYLAVVDFDNREYYESVKNLLPSTFTVLSGGKKLPHLYYYVDKPVRKVAFKDIDKNTLCDVQGERTQVIAPNSYNSKGGLYELYDDREITIIKYDDLIDKLKESSMIVEEKLNDINNKYGGQNKVTNKIPCSKHNDHEPSLHVYDDGSGYCYVCDAYFTPEAIKQPKEALLSKTKKGGKKYYVPIHDLKSENINVTPEGLSMAIHLKQWNLVTEIVSIMIMSNNIFKTTMVDQASEVWYYQDGIYKDNGASLIKECCKDILRINFSKKIVEEIINKIKVSTFVEKEVFFNSNQDEPYVLPVKNGLLNLKTRELCKFTPEKYYFSKLNAAYDPSNKNNDYLDFINSLVSEKDLVTLQEMMGFTLVRKYLYQKFFFLNGKGSNGKSAFLDYITYFLGHRNITQVSLTDLQKDQYSKALLYNKMLNVSAELSSDLLSDSDILKQLTGGDWISANRKHLSHLMFKNYAKIVFAMNKLPPTKDLSDGFFRRVMVIDFSSKFQEACDYDPNNTDPKIKLADPEILSKITTQECIDGFLLWCMEGLDRIIKNKGFTQSATTDERRTDYLRRTNSFKVYCEENLVADDDFEYATISKDGLRRNYNDYCKKYDLPVESDKSIKYYMTTVLGSSENRVSEDGVRVRQWVGVRYKEKKEVQEEL